MRFRWKHRICAECRWLINRYGYASILASEMSQGLEVVSGNCGYFLLEAAVLPPPQAKLSTLNYKAGEVKIRRAEAPLISRASKGKWINLEVSDLNKLEKVDPPKIYMGRAVGPVISGAPALMMAKTNSNKFAALLCRMFRSHPVPGQDVWLLAHKYVDLILSNFNSPPCEMSTLDWLNSMPSDRRKPLAAAMKLFEDNGWSSKFEKFHAFVKEEILPGFSKDEHGLHPITECLARLIYAPHDVTHVIAGPKIKPYLSWLKEQWHEDNFIFYGSTTPDHLHNWLQRLVRSGPSLYFWSDYSQFEVTHSSETWEFVESFYAQHKSDPLFQKVLEIWRAPCGTLGDLKFTGRIMNASGRDDTAFANALLNGVAMYISVTAAWYSKPLQMVECSDLVRIQSDLLLSVCGDDALGRLPSVEVEEALRFVKAARANLESFGFNAKMFCSDRLEDCVYLAHRPILVDGTWYWGKTLGRCLYKLGYQRNQRGDPAAFFRGICEMHQVCSKHVPVLSDITSLWLKATQHNKVTKWIADPNKPWELMGSAGPGHYSLDTLQCLARAYTVNRRPCRSDLSMEDITVTAEDFEHLIDFLGSKIEGIPCVLDHWLLRHMVWVDEQ